MATGRREERSDSLNGEECDTDGPGPRGDALGLDPPGPSPVEGDTGAGDADRSGVVTHVQRGSPLECITELVEVEASSPAPDPREEPGVRPKGPDPRSGTPGVVRGVAGVTGVSDGDNDENLIEILRTCEAQVERLERLESSSLLLSDQLHSARSLATRLHHRVLYLEHQNHLKDEELHELAVSLQKKEEAPRAGASRRPSITDQAAKNMPNPASANGRVTTNSHPNRSSSRVCTLL